MRPLAVSLIACLCLTLAAGPAIRPAAAVILPAATAAEAPSAGEHLAGSAITLLAGGVPPLAIAVLALSYGWTAPLLCAFALGGAALAMVLPNERALADHVHPGIRATAGAVRGLLFFPALSGLAARRVYAPLAAEAIHAVRAALSGGGPVR